ncbi:MAG TPA: hypothetical protein DDY78_00620 [Planctomycetales bacterium]|jgi:hypothetical protein|nr:hypothetical protein [Planctomycetales bacterium]
MRLSGPHGPLAALGMTSLVQGVISLILGVIPVLGIPIGLFGLLFGLLALVATFLKLGPNLRVTLGGVAASLLALTVNFAVAFAPVGYRPDPTVPRILQAVPDRPSNPPPAPSRRLD